MSTQLVTLTDLQQFRIELLNELKKMLKSESPEPPRQWLKSYEVRNMLGISRGTLQAMRDNGTLKATKVGGLMFYAYNDIVKLMHGKK
jgi:hypothetical protein